MTQRKRVRSPSHTPSPCRWTATAFLKLSAKVRSLPGRLRVECSRTLLVWRALCLRVEVGAIPIGSANGSERRSQRGFQHHERRFDSFPSRCCCSPVLVRDKSGCGSSGSGKQWDRRPKGGHEAGSLRIRVRFPSVPPRGGAHCNRGENSASPIGLV